MLIESGSVTQDATKQMSKFSVVVPMDLIGGSVSGNATIEVSNVNGSGTLHTGPITKVHYDLVQRMVGITGKDASLPLHTNKTSETWVNQTGPQIVQKLCGKAGVPCSVSAASGLMAGKKVKDDFVKMSDNTTFAYVIHKLAEMDGARFFTDQHGTFHYMDQKSSGGGFTINYKAPSSSSPMVCDALHLVVVEDLLAAGIGETSVPTWNPRDKKAYTGQSGSSGGGIGGISSTPKFHLPGMDQAHAQQYAKTRQEELQRHALTVTAICVGDANVSPLGGLTLNGTGLFDGSYTIDQIHHSFGVRGYTMTITAKSGAADQGVWSAQSGLPQVKGPAITPPAAVPVPGL